MVRWEQYNVTRQISTTARKELIKALRARYRSAAFGDRIRILDEFVALTGYHRKHAIRVLGQEFSNAKAARARNRLYDEAVRQALTPLWEAVDRVCGKRLKALIPMLVDAMERHGHLDLDPVIKTKPLQVSAATIDRILAAARLHIDGQRKRRAGVPWMKRATWFGSEEPLDLMLAVSLHACQISAAKREARWLLNWCGIVVHHSCVII